MKDIGKEPSVSLMRPLIPEESRSHDLINLAADLLSNSSTLAAKLHPTVAKTVGDLVRSMNCYYSNLIEDHNTHPRDIDKALADHFSSDPKKRALQKEAKSHIALQKKIDLGEIPRPVVSAKFIKWLHFEFCHLLPQELLLLESTDNNKNVIVIPGEFRQQDVIVGRHTPPSTQYIESFIDRFVEGYSLEKHNRFKQIILVAASHHRLLWIHPFIDGNGRVARLFSHALLKEIGVGSSLWSVARGLARRVNDYKAALQEADSPRHGDLDGRGNLSAKGLENFCTFFLTVCLDQIAYMDTLLQPTELGKRIQRYVENEIYAGKLSEGSWPLLREALYEGELERGRATELTGYKERQARTILKTLLDKKLLVSDTPKGLVRLNFPLEVVESWFPQLYPAF